MIDAAPVDAPETVAAPEVVADATPAAEIPADDANLSTHEAAFGAEGTVLKDDPAKRRHRQKDIATPADVPRIAELTKKFRTAEQDAAQWRAKYEATQKPATPTPAAVAPPQPSATPVTDKFSFPTFDAWNVKNPDKGWDDWDDAKMDARDAWRDAQREAKDSAALVQQQHQQGAQQVRQVYADRVVAFMKTTPDYQEKVDAVGQSPVPPVFEQALLTADNGPQLVYTLAQRPDLLAELHLMGEGKAVTDASVASAQRWLTSRLQTVPTGSVLSTPSTVSVPRPPNPVRTGPLTPGDEPPGDGASLRDHEKFYGVKPRR